ncbi:hypothetical protein [Trinickia violacea]|nr:hypothetical protein [Trinickia violacea]
MANAFQRNDPLTIVNDLPLDDQTRLGVQAGLIVFQTALSAALTTQ